MIKLLAGLRRTPAPEAPAPVDPSVDPLAEAEAAEARALAAEADAKRQAILNAAELRATEARLKRDAIEHRARLAAEERERVAEVKRQAAAEEERKRQAAARSGKRRDRGDRARQTIGEHSARLRRLAINLGVNSAAGYGQFEHFTNQGGLDGPWAAALAVLLELLAVTVLDYGLEARKKGRPFAAAFALAALVAVGVAALNYSHWSVTAGRQGLAIPFAVMSLMSPLLWAWYDSARDAERGGVVASAGRAVATFEPLRWLFWPRVTLAAKRQAVRHRITDGEHAIELAVEHLAAKAAAKAAAREQKALDRAASKRQGELPPGNGDNPNDDDEEFVEELPGVPTPEVLATMTDGEIREAARDSYRQARVRGSDVTGEQLGDAYGRSESWGRTRMREVKPFIVINVEDGGDETAATP